MAIDYVADIAKYTDSVDEAVVNAMLKTYALVLKNQDAAQVSFSDPAELETVRENFLKKKLGLSDSNEVLDAAIAEVGSKISGRKNRITVYYLLAQHFNKLSVLK